MTNKSALTLALLATLGASPAARAASPAGATPATAQPRGAGGETGWDRVEGLAQTHLDGATVMAVQASVDATKEVVGSVTSGVPDTGRSSASRQVLEAALRVVEADSAALDVVRRTRAAAEASRAPGTPFPTGAKIRVSLYKVTLRNGSSGSEAQRQAVEQAVSDATTIDAVAARLSKIGSVEGLGDTGAVSVRGPTSLTLDEETRGYVKSVSFSTRAGGKGYDTTIEPGSFKGSDVIALAPSVDGKGLSYDARLVRLVQFDTFSTKDAAGMDYKIQLPNVTSLSATGEMALVKDRASTVVVADKEDPRHATAYVYAVEAVQGRE